LGALESLSGRGVPLAAKPNIGQAGRVSGITPADLAVLLLYLR